MSVDVEAVLQNMQRKLGDAERRASFWEVAYRRLEQQAAQDAGKRDVNAAGD